MLGRLRFQNKLGAGVKQPRRRLGQPTELIIFGAMAMQSRHSDKTTDLAPGTRAPSGIYVVSHRDPSHASPHEVMVPVPTILPMCNACAGVRFSRSLLPVPIGEHKFFWPPGRRSPGASRLRRLFANFQGPSTLYFTEHEDTKHRRHGGRAIGRKPVGWSG